VVRLKSFLAADANAADQFKKLMGVYAEQIGHLPRTAAVLLRADQSAEAARVLRSGWPRLSLNWPNADVTRYDAEIEKLLPSMLEKLERDDERYFAKVLFAAMPDVKQPKQTSDNAGVGLPSRDQRLGKLASQFASIDFKDPALKKLCLVILSDSDAVGKQVAAEVAAEFDPKSILLAYANDDQTHLTQESRLAKRHLRNRLREGDFAAYVDLLNRLSANPSDNDYEFGNVVNPFIECAIDALRDKNAKMWTAEQCAAVAAAMRRTLEDREYVNMNNAQDFNTMLVALHCQADTCDELTQWMKKISNHSRSRVGNGGVMQEVWRFGVRLNGPATAENLDARIQYLQNVMRWAFEQQWLKRTGVPYRMRGQTERNFLTSVAKSGLLTPEELKTHGARATEGIGPKEEPGYAKAVFANWLITEKEYEMASDVWRSLIKISPDAKQVPRNEANYVLGLAVCLKNLKRYDEALAALAMLEGKDFDQALKGSYEQYKREIEDAAKAESTKNSNGDSPTSDKSSQNIPKQARPYSRSLLLSANRLRYNRPSSAGITPSDLGYNLNG